MRDLAICSAEAVEAALKAFDPDAVILIHSPERHSLQVAGVSSLDLAFHDIETFHPRYRGISHFQLEDFLAFASGEAQRLLVTCQRGLSRSPALAILALIARGARPAAACAAVHAAVPCASPNRQVLRLGAERLALGVSLVELAEAAFTYRRGPYGPIGESQPLRRISPGLENADEAGTRSEADAAIAVVPTS